MKVLMSWSYGHSDLVLYPKRWMVVASTMVRYGGNFRQETLLKKMNSILKILPGYGFSVDTLGWRDNRVPLEII